MAQEQQQAMQAQMQQSMVDQAGQLASAPMADPSKNPELNAPEGEEPPMQL